MWRDVFLTNKDAVLSALKEISSDIAALATLLDTVMRRSRSMNFQGAAHAAE